MRSFLLASIAALAFPACTQDITGVGGPGDDQQGASCGNGTVETGEACDDGNTAAGDGCSATCTTETSATPRIAGSVNPVTLELYNPLSTNLSLTSEGGFVGTVNLSASLVDGTGAAITGATVTIAATADLTDGQTQSIPLTIMVPLSATGADMTGMLKVDATTSTTDPVHLAVAADIKAIFEWTYAAGTGTVVNNHGEHGGTFTVLRGTVIRIKNDDTIGHITHAGAVTGQTNANFVHESQDPAVGGLPGKFYDLPTNVSPPGSQGTIGCHDHGTGTYMTVTVM
ncbi:MAG: myxococcus cysteine-rich repeat containing protein [Kofleriaceae bacterium]